MVIYKIVNLINGKIYVGQTIGSAFVRFSEHKSDARRNRKSSALHAAMRFYGFDNFSVSTICRANSVDELNNREAACIRLYGSLAPNGYNIALGGNNSLKSLETRSKISDRKSTRLNSSHHSISYAV